jgi:hypothetical protein
MLCHEIEPNLSKDRAMHEGDSNIPLSSAYGVYISQLIRYARTCFAYENFSKRSKLLTKKLLQGYNQSRLKSSFHKFYGRYNDLVCDYKLSLGHMLNDLFHFPFRLSFPYLTTGNLVYLISTKGPRQVWPVRRGCLLLHGNWSYLHIYRGSVLPYTRFCICLLDVWLPFTYC